MRLAASLPAVLALSTCAAAAPASFALRMIVDCGSGDAERMPLKRSHEDLCVDRSAIASGADLTAVFVSRDDRMDEDVIHLHFDNSGARKLRAATARNVNGRMGVVLNGRLIGAPYIMDRISREMMVAGAANRSEDVKRIAAKIRASMRQQR